MRPSDNTYLMLALQCVIYTIVHFKGSHTIRRETYHGELDTAKALAVAAVEKGGADRVEVRDVSGQLAFHYPRTFRT